MILVKSLILSKKNLFFLPPPHKIILPGDSLNILIASAIVLAVNSDKVLIESSKDIPLTKERLKSFTSNVFDKLLNLSADSP